MEMSERPFARGKTFLRNFKNQMRNFHYSGEASKGSMLG
jgi:hypothetical protein